MNKKLKEFFVANGMSLSGNRAYGIVNGYETNVLFNSFADRNFPLQWMISCNGTDEQKRNIEAEIRAAALRFCAYRFTPYGLLLGLNDFTVGKLVKRLPELFTLVYGILAKNGATIADRCPVCGLPFEENNSKQCNINGFSVRLGYDCLNSINATISAENREFDEAPNNYLKGFLGALIGGLAGALIGVVIYLIGFISSISSIVAVLLGSWLYQKFHGKPNKTMILIVAATTVVCMVLSVLIIYITASGIAAAEEGLAISAFEAFDICMKDAEFSRLFYSDLAMVLLFSAIGVGVEIFYMFKRVQRQQNIK